MIAVDFQRHIRSKKLLRIMTFIHIRHTCVAITLGKLWVLPLGKYAVVLTQAIAALEAIQAQRRPW